MKFLSKKQVRDLVGLSSTQCSRLENEGRFPLRVRVGFRVFYVEEEILEWMRIRIAERTPPIAAAAD